jgi:hypothetical protein
MLYLQALRPGDATGRSRCRWVSHAGLPRISGRHGTNDMDELCREHPSSPKHKRQGNHPTLGLVMRCLECMAQHGRHALRAHLPIVAQSECSTPQPCRKKKSFGFGPSVPRPLLSDSRHASSPSSPLRRRAGDDGLVAVVPETYPLREPGREVTASGFCPKRLP